MDEDRAYAIVDVLKDEQPALNLDCETEEERTQEEAEEDRDDSRRFSGVSRRMIEQFFTEVEGPDRDWRDPDENIFGEGEREELILAD